MNRSDFRTEVRNLLTGLEFSGYGDFDFTDTEMDSYLALAVARLFPALYFRDSQDAIATSSYGTRGKCSATVTDGIEDRIYMVEDAEEQEALEAWSTRPGKVVDICDAFTSVNVYFYDAYTMPDDDITEADWPERWNIVVTTGAALEVMAARRDAGKRPDPPSGSEMSAFDRLQGRYDDLVRSMAMTLPAVRV